MPLGYEVFAGNTNDVTTVQQIVAVMEQRYGTSNRIWVMDRGMVSEANLKFLREGGRRYIVGTPKSMLKKFEQQLLQDDWHKIREGLEVKLCVAPRDVEDDEDAADAEPTEDTTDTPPTEAAVTPPKEVAETFILCRSQDRWKKEDAMLRRFEQKIETRLKSMATRCEKQKRRPARRSLLRSAS